MNRQVNLEAAEMRQLATVRYEDLYRAAQQGVIEGSAVHIKAAADVLEKQAKLNGYIAPQRLELSGKDGRAITIESLDKLIADADKSKR